MNPKMMGATCTNRLRSLLTLYDVLKFLEKHLKNQWNCGFKDINRHSIIMLSAQQSADFAEKVDLTFTLQIKT